VLVEGHLYGLLESGLLACIELKTGEIKWQERLAGKGSVISAEGRLYCRSEGKGTVTLVETNPKQLVTLGSFDPPERSSEPAWSQPVLANARLYLRDHDQLLSYNVKAK
jgi:alcohol dehydrogenase (cytochrome c)